MSKYFEVHLRGENESKLQAWRPEGGKFGCTAMEARQRHDDLVEAGEGKQTIDGVVPFVVEIVKVRTQTKDLSAVDSYGRVGTRQKYEVKRTDSMLVSIVDGKGDVTQAGPWAPFLLPDPKTLN